MAKLQSYARFLLLENTPNIIELEESKFEKEARFDLKRKHDFEQAAENVNLSPN